MEAAELGARLARFREAAGLTGTELGHRVGLSKSQISKIESGVRRIDVSELAEFADVLGVGLADLLGTARRGSVALAARVMAVPAVDADRDARRRLRQMLEADGVLADTCGLKPPVRSNPGSAVFETVDREALGRGSAAAAGEKLALVVRDELGLGRGAIADLAELAEMHFGVDLAIWPVGDSVSGLCAHGPDVATVLVSSSLSAGHERFTAAHELAHHLLGDPRDVLIEADLYDASNPTETRANAFAAALLMPEAGVRERIGSRSIGAEVIGELLRHFRVSYRALVYRLRNLRLISPSAMEGWLATSASSVLRAAGDPNPDELTDPTETRRVPPRLWRAAIEGYESGKVGIGVLASLRDTDAEELYGQLVAEGIQPPPVFNDAIEL